MDPRESPRLQAAFRAIVRWRWFWIVLYALLFPAALASALRIETDNSVNRLIVRTDPDAIDTAAFEAIFPESESVVLLAEAADPFAPAVLERVGMIESRLASLPGVEPSSILSIAARAVPGAGREAAARPAGAEDLRRFATGTVLFRRQGLVGDDFLGIAITLRASGPLERDRLLASIDRALRPFEARLAPLRALRRVGGPYVDAYLEAETSRASLRYFPLFGLFVVAVNLVLYRSARTLAAFLITLAVAVTLGVGWGGAAGFCFTIVSSLVPLTILVTCTATLVYLQSRFVENPGCTPAAEHQAFALANKFVATTASIVAAAAGFAALAVSRIRPIRDMGLWVAGSLLLTWVVAFTLFPALQAILKTPMLGRRTHAGRLLLRSIDALPEFSWRRRRVILVSALFLMLGGIAAIAGIPGCLAPMRLQTDALEYIDHALPLYRDTRRLEAALGGLTVAQVWVRTPDAGVLDPEILRGLERFTRALEADGRVASVFGPTTLLRFLGYVAGRGDRLPEEPAAWPPLAAALDGLLLQEPALREWIEVGRLSDARLTVILRDRDATVGAIHALIEDHWRATAAEAPALAGCRARVVGQALLQAKIAEYLVPTLTESFALTAGIILLAFLVVFRSPAARLMAIIPSLFAILVMFLVMRLAAIPLNVATILIASTVLGASENDQIHFFYHFQEARASGSAARALRHALHVAGRAILFATLINASGFLALALSGLPPMRQFGIMAASAFLLSMLASFVVLPASMWVVFRERPEPAAAGPAAP